MSMPINACLMKRALTDAAAFAELHRRMEYNKKKGSSSVFACREHNPPCELTDAQVRALDDKLFDAITGHPPAPPFPQATGKPILRTYRRH